MAEKDIKEGDVVSSYDGKYYLKGNEPVKTDVEISAARQALYESTSDPLFASYQQGVGTLQSYIDAKAQIGLTIKIYTNCYDP